MSEQHWGLRVAGCAASQCCQNCPAGAGSRQVLLKQFRSNPVLSPALISAYVTSSSCRYTFLHMISLVQGMRHTFLAPCKASLVQCQAENNAQPNPACSVHYQWQVGGVESRSGCTCAELKSATASAVVCNSGEPSTLGTAFFDAQAASRHLMAGEKLVMNVVAGLQAHAHRVLPCRARATSNADGPAQGHVCFTRPAEISVSEP